MLKAQVAFARVALALVLASALLTRSYPAGAAGVAAQQHPTTAAQEKKPTAIWSIRWTVNMTAHASYGDDTRQVEEQYRFNHTASFLYREFEDGDADNTEFRMRVADDYQSAETYTCEDSEGHSGQAHEYNHIWTTNPDSYNDNPAGFYILSTMKLPDEGWQAYLSFEFNPGYYFNTNQYENGSTCSGTYSRSTALEPMYWMPLCTMVKTMTGNAQGTEFTYHADGTDMSIGCMGPAFYALNSSDIQVQWSTDISAQLVQGRDLTVEKLEVTQGIQDDGNSLPLVQGRKTIARAYIGIGSEPGPVLGVSGVLEGYAGGSKLGSVSPINDQIDAPNHPDWKKVDDTLNFELPEEWTQQPSLHLKAKVNDGHKIVEPDYENNDRTADVTFRDCKGVSIGYAPVHYQPPGFAGADPSGSISAGQAFMQKIYPISDTGLEYVPRGATTLMQNVNISPTHISLLDSLEQMLLVSSPPRPEHIFGWLPANAYDGNGAAYRPGISGFGNDTESPDRWRRTFAHELGHNFDLRHPAGTPTTNGAHWFDVYDMSIKPAPSGGSALIDFMVPARLEPEAWISPDNWEYLIGQLCSGGAAAAAGPAVESRQPEVSNNLLVTAVIDDATPVTGRLQPLVRLTTAPVHTLPPGAQYCVDLLDASHQRLSYYCFDLTVEGDATTSPGAGVASMVVPVPAGLARVELLATAGGRLLSSRSASAHAPAVVVTYPSAPGLTLAGRQTINWTGSDLDGDPLTYHVLYSRDNGATWQGAAAGVTGGSVEVDFSALPGTTGATGLIRVLASDGFNTAQDTSDSTFTVGKKGPSAWILSPSSGATLSSQAQVTLRGAGVDLEDGTLGDSALSWTSDKDGALGTGRVLETSLAAGTHTITLTATDSAGQKATAHVQVTVAAPRTPKGVYVPLIVK